MDDVVILGIAGGVGDGSDSTELDGVADLVVAHDPPGALFIVLDLFFQLRLVALGLRDHIAHDLHDVGGVEIVFVTQRVVLILDQIIARRKAGNGVFTRRLCAAVRVRGQILGSFLGERLRLCRGRQGLGEFGSIREGVFALSLAKAQKGGFAGIGNAAAPDNVRENRFPIFVGTQVAGEDLVRLVGVPRCFVVDGDRVGFSRRERGGAQCQREHQCQQQSE